MAAISIIMDNFTISNCHTHLSIQQKNRVSWGWRWCLPWEKRSFWITMHSGVWPKSQEISFLYRGFFFPFLCSWVVFALHNFFHFCIWINLPYLFLALSMMGLTLSCWFYTQHISIWFLRLIFVQQKCIKNLQVNYDHRDSL